MPGEGEEGVLKGGAADGLTTRLWCYSPRPVFGAPVFRDSACWSFLPADSRKMPYARGALTDGTFLRESWTTGGRGQESTKRSAVDSKL